MNFEDWYRENEAYLVTQPFTNYLAAAAWKAGQASGREQAAKYCDEAAIGNAATTARLRWSLEALAARIRGA